MTAYLLPWNVRFFEAQIDCTLSAHFRDDERNASTLSAKTIGGAAQPRDPPTANQNEVTPAGAA